MKRSPKRTTRLKPKHWPSSLAWYAALELALERGDEEAAARARKELRRLGVRVHHVEVGA